MSADFLLPIALALIGALEAGLQAGFIHRDVTPANIMRIGAVPAHWVLGDWGLVRQPGATSEVRTAKGAQFGTAGFSSPESWVDAHSLDFRADIYSFGRVIEWASTGLVPTPNSKANAPEPWRSLVESACSRRPEERPQSYEALRSLLPQAHSDELGTVLAPPLGVLPGRGEMLERRFAVELSGQLLAAADRVFASATSLVRTRSINSTAAMLLRSELTSSMQAHFDELMKVVQQIDLLGDNEFRLATGEVVFHALRWKLASLHPNGEAQIQESRKEYDVRTSPRLRRFVRGLVE